MLRIFGCPWGQKPCHVAHGGVSFCGHLQLAAWATLAKNTTFIFCTSSFSARILHSSPRRAPGHLIAPRYSFYPGSVSPSLVRPPMTRSSSCRMRRVETSSGCRDWSSAPSPRSPPRRPASRCAPESRGQHQCLSHLAVILQPSRTARSVLPCHHNPSE